jgi:hypothetical protein
MAGANIIPLVNKKPLPIQTVGNVASVVGNWTTIGLIIYFGGFLLSILQLNQQIEQPDQAWYGPWVIATILMLTFPLLLIRIFPPAFNWTFICLSATSCLTVVALIILLTNKISLNSSKNNEKNNEKRANSNELLYTRLYTGIVIGLFAIIAGKNTVGQCYGQIVRWLPTTYLNYPTPESIIGVFGLGYLVTLFIL